MRTRPQVVIPAGAGSDGGHGREGTGWDSELGSSFPQGLCGLEFMKVSPGPPVFLNSTVPRGHDGSSWCCTSCAAMGCWRGSGFVSLGFLNRLLYTDFRHAWCLPGPSSWPPSAPLPATFLLTFLPVEAEGWVGWEGHRGGQEGLGKGLGHPQWEMLVGETLREWVWEK